MIALGGMIQSSGQTALNSHIIYRTDTGTICLTFQQFDFYAQSLIERNGLCIDTMIMGKQLISKSNEIHHLNEQLNLNSIMIQNQEKISQTYKKSFDDLGVSYKKVVKKNNRLKQTCYVLTSFFIILGIVVLIN